MSATPRPFGCRLDDPVLLPGDKPGDRVCGIARRVPRHGIQVRVRTYGSSSRQVLLTPVALHADGSWRPERHQQADSERGIIRGVALPGTIVGEMIELLKLAEIELVGVERETPPLIEVNI